MNKKEVENEREEGKTNKLGDSSVQFDSSKDKDNEEETQFYDAYDHEEAKNRKKGKKKLKKKQKKAAKRMESKQIEQVEKAIDVKENDEKTVEIQEIEDDGTWTKVEITKTNMKDLKEVKIKNEAKKEEMDKVKILEEQMVKEITLKEFNNFFVYNEEVNTIIIKGLLDVDHQLNKPSKRHENDFKAACELLYALGIELLPLAVQRTAEFGTGAQRPPLKVFLRNETLVKIVLEIWANYSYSFTRAYNKPAWEYVFIHENRKIKAENPNLNRNIASKLVKALNEVDDNVPSSTKRAYLANKKKHQENIVNPLQNALKTALLNATEENPLEILLMTAPTDLVQVLVRNPQLSNRIGRVHLMGGWTELRPTWDENRQVIRKGVPTVWSNYNLAMAPESAKRLFQMNIPVRLYTYRDVREVFNGSVNEEKFGDIIKLIEQSGSQVMKDFLKAAKSWDQHVLKTMPYLHAAIGKYAGKQFSPADPILVVGLTSPEFMQTARTRKIKLKFEHQELSMGDVLEVQIEYDVPESKVELVTSINKDVFYEIFHYELQMAIRTYSPKVQIQEIRALPRYKITESEGVISVQRDVQCLSCKEYGHMVKDCPDPVQCHRCKEYGHMVKDCPQPVQCHQCKDYGHMVKDCPKNKNKDACFKCGVTGHFARNCPNKNRPQM